MDSSYIVFSDFRSDHPKRSKGSIMKKLVIGGLLLAAVGVVLFLFLREGMITAPEEKAVEKVVGSVLSLKGSAHALRDNQQITLNQNDEIHRKDVVTTDADGYIRIAFHDDTLVAIGKNGELSIEDYFYEANNTEMRTDLWFKNGLFESITGKIGKIAPDRIKLKAKTATMGIRGTHIVGDLTDEKKIKIACIEGKIEVKSKSVTKHVRIDKKGEKVEVDTQVLDSQAELGVGKEIVIESKEVVLEANETVPRVVMEAPEPKEYTYEEIVPILEGTGNEDLEKVQEKIQQSLKMLTSLPDVRVKRGLFYIGVGINADKLDNPRFKITEKDKNIKLNIDRKNGTVRIKPPNVVYGEYRFAVDAKAEGQNEKKSYIVVVEKNREWDNIQSGNGFVIAVKTDHTLWAWGRNDHGQLGDGSTDDRKDPVAVEADKRWLKAAAGGSHALAIDTDGKLWAWGSNRYGQLGDGSKTDRKRPVMIGGDHNWSAVAAGDEHSLAIRDDGTLWSWGQNVAGKIGDGTTLTRTLPKRIGFDNDWSMIACGDNYSLALKRDGTLWSWGQNEFGQIGQSAKVVTPEPSRIGKSDQWIRIAAAGETSFALRKDGTLWGWGYNGFGQLGDGSRNDVLTPKRLAAKQKWQAVYPGSRHTIAIDQQGRLWGWGNNDMHQLASTTAPSYLNPRMLSQASGWLSALPGENYTLALKPDRSFEAWGRVNRKMVETLVVDVRGTDIEVAKK